MRASRRRAGASLIAGVCLLFASAAAYADDLLVMPYTCSMMGGRPVLTPAREQSHRIIGPREQRPYTACSPSNPDMCRNWVVHRFDLECAGARVPWVAVVASFEAQSGRAWLDNGRLVMRMPRAWSFDRDDPCARPLSGIERFDFRMRRYCADRRAAAPPVVEMPFGFAPMLGIDGIFVRSNGPGAGSRMGPPVASGGPFGEPDDGMRRGERFGSDRPRMSEREFEEPSPFERRPSPEPPVLHPDRSAQRPPPAPAPQARGEPLPPREPSRETAQAAPKPLPERPKTAAAPPPPKHEVEPAPAPKVAAIPEPPKAAPPPATNTPSAAPAPQGPAPAKQATAPASEPAQVVVPKIINRPETAASPQAPAEAQPAPSVAGAPPPTAPEAPPQPTQTAAAPADAEPISVNLLSAVQSPTIGMVSFAALALVVLGAFVIARRRERTAGVPPMRDISAVSLGAAGRARPKSEPRLPVPTSAPPAPPTLSRGAPPPPPAPTGAWTNRIPQTRAEAMQVLGMGVSPDATETALKKVVDGLRMSWHPDLAKDEADRQLREFRLKQINAAWDLMRGTSVERLDS